MVNGKNSYQTNDMANTFCNTHKKKLFRRYTDHVFTSSPSLRVFAILNISAVVLVVRGDHRGGVKKTEGGVTGS